MPGGDDINIERAHFTACDARQDFPMMMRADSFHQLCVQRLRCIGEAAQAKCHEKAHNVLQPRALMRASWGSSIFRFQYLAANIGTPCQPAERDAEAQQQRLSSPLGISRELSVTCHAFSPFHL